MTNTHHRNSVDRKSGIVLPGFKPVMELLAGSPEKISKIYCLENLRSKDEVAALCQRHGIALELRRQDALDDLLGARDHKVAHQGLIAILKQINLVSDESLFCEAASAPLPLVLALDQVQDPGNLGTLCRTAYALGAAGILLPKHESATFGSAAFKASTGALAVMPIAMAVNLGRSLDTAEEQGLSIYGAGLPEGIAPPEDAFSFAWQLPAILVLGNEKKGIRPGVAKRCSHNVMIPFQRPFDSLNIAQAGAVLLGLCARSFFMK